MKIPLSLIRSFLPLDLTPEKIGESLTMLGLEVDAILPSPGGDAVFEISLTPNLGHCMSALGVARELSASLRIPLRLPPPSVSKYEKPPSFQVAIREKQLCPRYLCLSMENAAISPSPPWLQEILTASGMHPVCNAVDAANYIMLKRGQPFHIFDADAIVNQSLVIEKLEKPISFTGLDNLVREVPEESLVIKDAQGVLAIAGILGAARGSVKETTRNILIESALFDPASIRRTAKRLSFRSESSHRFERGVDPNGSFAALEELAGLLKKLCGAHSVHAPCFLGEREVKPRAISLRLAHIRRLLGVSLSAAEVSAIFHWLQFPLEEKSEGVWIVSVPAFRADISEEVDLVEEVARIYGYHHIDKPAPLCAPSRIPHAREYLFEKKARHALWGLGLQEFLNADLISPRLAESAMEWIRPGASLLSAVHAKTEEYSILRPSLLPGMMQSAQENRNHKIDTLHAFEIGRIHFLQNHHVVEESMAAILLTGEAVSAHWSRKPSEVDFFDLKGILENWFETMHISFPICEPSSHPSFHPNRQANLILQECCLGSFGEVHPAIAEKLGVKKRVFYAEINLRLCMGLVRGARAMEPLAQYPNSERDATFSLPLEMPIAQIFQIIASHRSLLLEKAWLIDLYLPEGNPTKSATFRFSYRDPLKTISLEEVEAAHAQLLNSLLKEISLA